MAYLKKVTCSLLLAVGLTLPLNGQTEGNRNAGAKQVQETVTVDTKVMTPIQRQALAMLEPLWTATNGLDPDLTKLFVRAQIADTLWEFNEPRARKLFKETLLTSTFEQSEKRALRLTSVSQQNPQWRAEIIQHWIAERDPAWANQLVLQNLTKPGKNETDIWMVKVLVFTDPQRAGQIIKQLITRKKAIWLYEILTNLRRKDAQLADDLFAYALTTGPQDDDSPLSYFIQLSNYVFSLSEDLDMTVPAMTSSLKPELIKQYFEFGYKSLMAEAASLEQESKKKPTVGEHAAYSYNYVVRILPFFDKYMPDLTGKINARWKQVILGLQGGKELISQTKASYDGLNVQSLLKEAEQVTDEGERQMLYRRAAYVYISENNVDQAAPVLPKMDAEARNTVEQEIHLMAAKIAIAKGNPDTAYRHSREVEYLRPRIELLCQVAGLYQDNDQPERALEIINETEKSLEKVKDGPDKVSTFFMVADAATRLNPARGFEVMKSVIEAINRSKWPDGRYSVSIGYNDFDENMLLLARTDFARSLEMAKSINLKEGNIAAQVAICRSVLLQN
jgi:hypothetical protein